MRVVEVINRTIDVASLNGQIIAFDNNSYTIRFHFKKMFNEETDLSTYTWYLIFVNSEERGDVVALSSPTLDGESHFYVDWQPGGVFTQVGGGCYLQLFGVSGENKWHTEQCYIVVGKALTSDSSSPLTPSVLLTYLTTFQGLRDNAAGSAAAAADAATAAINAKDAAIAAKDLAVSSKDTAVSASGTAVAAKDIAVQSKNDAQTAKTDAVAAKTAAETAKEEARAYAEIAEAAGGTYAVVINGVPYSILFCVDDDQTHLGLKFSPISA